MTCANILRKKWLQLTILKMTKHGDAETFCVKKVSKIFGGMKSFL